MKKTNQETITSRDIYELAFFITKTACKIEGIKVTEELGKPACVVTVSGDNLKQLQLDYLNNHAPVDAVSYRKSLSYIRSLVYGEMNKSKKEGGYQ
jgi:hypothetical protein